MTTDRTRYPARWRPEPAVRTIGRKRCHRSGDCLGAVGTHIPERREHVHVLVSDSINGLPRGTEHDLPVHLDLAVEDRAAAVERFRDLGGAVRETRSEEFADQTHTWTVMEDPEGNEFCVSER